MILHKIYRKIDDIFWEICQNIVGRKAIDRKNRSKLINQEVSIVASTCNGGVIYHDLGLQYRSPFINLWIEPDDFIKLLSDLRGYLSYDLQFVGKEGIPYPIAVLKDIYIYFQHYKTEEEAETCWRRRLKRMDYDNIAVFFTDRDGCTYETLKRFDSLPYERKVVFTHADYPELESAFYYDCFSEEQEVGVLTEYSNDKLKIRYLDKYDYVTLLNKGK